MEPQRGRVCVSACGSGGLGGGGTRLKTCLFEPLSPQPQERMTTLVSVKPPSFGLSECDDRKIVTGFSVLSPTFHLRCNQESSSHVLAFLNLKKVTRQHLPLPVPRQTAKIHSVACWNFQFGHFHYVSDTNWELVLMSREFHYRKAYKCRAWRILGLSVPGDGQGLKLSGLGAIKMSRTLFPSPDPPILPHCLSLKLTQADQIPRSPYLALYLLEPKNWSLKWSLFRCVIFGCRWC